MCRYIRDTHSQTINYNHRLTIPLEFDHFKQLLSHTRTNVRGRRQIFPNTRLVLCPPPPFQCSTGWLRCTASSGKSGCTPRARWLPSRQCCWLCTYHRAKPRSLERKYLFIYLTILSCDKSMYNVHCIRI